MNQRNTRLLSALTIAFGAVALTVDSADASMAPPLSGTCFENCIACESYNQIWLDFFCDNNGCPGSTASCQELECDASTTGLVCADPQ